jgi:hypothetical protein
MEKMKKKCLELKILGSFPRSEIVLEGGQKG